MIKNFLCKETEQLFNRFAPRHLPSTIHRIGLRKLVLLNAAVDINDLRVPPGNRLEKLSGKRKGQYSIRVNEKWRLCFRWKNGDAYDAEITDYHS